MKFRHIGSNEITLWVPVTLKAKDLGELLSRADRLRYLDFDIQICVTARPGWDEWLTDYTGQWATPPVGNYHTRILEAIGKYLDTTRVCEKFKTEIHNEINNG